jgi:acetate---CoA ligase (ADP-forming)
MMQLTPLFRPASIALIGASPNGTPGEVLANLQRIGSVAEIVPVNPNRSEVGGLRCHPSLTAAGRAVDVAAIMVKAARAPDALADCVRAGARSAVVFSDGFSEADPGGPALQEQLSAVARHAGLPLLGPNCMGYLAPAYGSALYIDRINRVPRAGQVGLVTQSGSVGVAGINQTGTLSLSAMISVGNEAGITLADGVRWLSRDGVTRAIAVFAEGFRDGRAFLAAAAEAIASGIPLVVCKTGRSAEAAVAARSHSGNLATDQRVVRAVLEAHGIAVVDDLDEFFAAVELLATGRRFTRRLAAVTLSGGHIGLLHDLAAESGVTFPAPSADAHQRVVEALGANRTVTNPLDGWVNDDVSGSVTRGLQTLADSGLAEGFVLAVDTPADPPTSFVEMGRSIAAAAVDFARRDPRPIAMIATTAAADDKAVTDLLREGSVPRLPALRPALAAWAAIARAQSHSTPALISPRTGVALGAMDEPAAYQLLGSVGLSVPRHEVCRVSGAVPHAARRIGYPVVIKAVSRTILHKTEARAVRLGIEDDAEAERTAEELLAMPTVEAVLVVETVPAGIEAFVGARVDASFGPVVVFGLGGIFTELLDDVAVLPAPVNESDVVAALDGLKLWRLMNGYRGQPRVPPAPLASAVAALSRLIAGCADPAISIDVNPLRLLADRAVALDAKVTGPAP